MWHRGKVPKKEKKGYTYTLLIEIPPFKIKTTHFKIQSSKQFYLVDIINKVRHITLNKSTIVKTITYNILKMRPYRAASTCE